MGISILTLTLTNQSQKARQHIYSRFAQTLQINLLSWRDECQRWQFMANGNFIFPGLHVNHNFVVNRHGSIKIGTDRNTYTNSFPFSRGYSATDFPRNSRKNSNLRPAPIIIFLLFIPTGDLVVLSISFAYEPMRFMILREQTGIIIIPKQLHWTTVPMEESCFSIRNGGTSNP